MIKIVKKQEISGKKALILKLATVVLALIAAAIVMLGFGYNPIEVYTSMIKGSLGTQRGITETVKKAIPLVILSLGVAVAFKMKFWNIGAEGQFYAGAIGSTFVALTFPQLPPYVLLPLMFIASVIMGGFLAFIPAILKGKLGASETLVTLMLNYIVVKFVEYLAIGPWRDPSQRGMNLIYKFKGKYANAVLPSVFGVHIGWIIAIVLVIAVYLLLKKSKLGYEIAVLGENERTAKYAGMSITKIILAAAIISGGLCGIAGFVHGSGAEKGLTLTMSGGLGFTAVITAWLSNLSAPAILFVSLVFAMLVRGGDYIQSSLQISSSISDVIQGVILFFILASEFLVNYKFVYLKKQK